MSYLQWLHSITVQEAMSLGKSVWGRPLFRINSARVMWRKLAKKLQFEPFIHPKWPIWLNPNLKLVGKTLHWKSENFQSHLQSFQDLLLPFQFHLSQLLLIYWRCWESDQNDNSSILLLKERGGNKFWFFKV